MTAGKVLTHELYQVDFPMNNKIISIELGILSSGGQVPDFHDLLISGRSQDT